MARAAGGSTSTGRPASGVGACIDEAGGWQHDTLTEDTDLSYRAQIEGVVVPVPAAVVVCPAEVPPTVSAFLMGQQHRWNKGLIQTAIKLLPADHDAAAPIRTKIEAWFHLTVAAGARLAIVLLAVMLAAPILLLPWRPEDLQHQPGRRFASA